MANPTQLCVVEDPDQAVALLQPIRLRLLAELAEPDSASGLARRIGLPRQQLNYHLRQLEAQGLLESVGERKRRGCTERLLRAVSRSYLISPSTLGQLGTDPALVQDKVSSAYLIAVAARAIREIATLRARAEEEDKRLATLTLQTDVRFATPKTQQAFAEELSNEFARLVAKYHDERAPEGRRFRVIAGSYPAPPEAPAPSKEERP